MSNDDTPTNTDPGEDNGAIKQLRAAAAEAPLLRKENAFLRAGIDLNEKMAQRMFAAYNGEMTVEAIKAEAEDWGIGQPAPPPDTAPDPSAGQQAARQALQGAPPAGAVPRPPVDEVKSLWDEFHNDGKRGVPLESRQLAAIDKVISSVSEGRKTFVHDEEAWIRERSNPAYDHSRRRG